LGSVVGEPEPRALALAADRVPELLAFADGVDRVRSLLPGFAVERATIHAAPEDLPPPPSHRCRELDPSEIASLDHLPADLLSELTAAANAGAPLVAAFDGVRPVAFTYAAWETETLWDVSIDTIESHRRQGYAAAAATHLMRTMKERGKSAVWGAAESNPASANLARRLGFVEVDQLWVLTRRDA
jgi:GNAT superfamily N-acetyltransferase